MGDKSTRTSESQHERVDNDHNLMISNRSDEDVDQKLDLEGVVKALGVPGKYQAFQIFCLSVSVLPFAFVILNYVFIGYEPPHKCHVINETEILARKNLLNDTASLTFDYGSCGITITSNRTGRDELIDSMGCISGYDFTGGKHVSMVTEWDLVCDKRGIVQLVQSLFTVGMSLGSVFFSSLADRYGRKILYIVASISLTITEFALAFAPNIYVAIILRFLSGISNIGMLVSHFVPCMELIISKYRQIFGLGHSMLWSTSIIVLSGIAFLFRNSDWRHFQLMASVECIPIFVFAYFVDETPMWYFAKGQYDNSKQILRKACKMNGKDPKLILDLFIEVVKKAQVKHHECESEKVIVKEADYTILAIFRNKRLLIATFILSLAWFTNSVTYYELFLTSSTLSGNRFLNFFIMAGLEIPSSLMCLAMLLFMGRRTVVLIFFALTGCSLLASTIFTATKSGNSMASTAFFLLGKFSIGSCFSVLFAYTPEVFPTTLRSCGLGVCNSFARLGGTVAPFMVPLLMIVPWAPGTILSALCFVCFILAFLLPETRGKQLPNTVGEFVELKRKERKR